MPGAPTVRKHASPGQRPGSRPSEDLSPERAAQFGPPFHGSAFFSLPAQGVALGWPVFGPLALHTGHETGSAWKHLLQRRERLRQRREGLPQTRDRMRQRREGLRQTRDRLPQRREGLPQRGKVFRKKGKPFPRAIQRKRPLFPWISAFSDAAPASPPRRMPPTPRAPPPAPRRAGRAPPPRRGRSLSRRANSARRANSDRA